MNSKFSLFLTAILMIGANSVLGQTVTGDNSTILLGNNNTISLGNAPDITRETRIAASSAPAANLRGLDKMSGESVDLSLETGSTAQFGYLQITLQDCRYPSDNPTGNAFAHLTIQSKDEQVFDGWMVASSPALVALDHPRYDVWVIRCKVDNRTPEVVAGESSPRPIMRP
jgi:hypothetical protein